MEKQELIDILNNMDSLQFANRLDYDKWMDFSHIPTVDQLLEYLDQGLKGGIKVRVKPKPKRVPLTSGQMNDLVDTSVITPYNTSRTVVSFVNKGIDNGCYILLSNSDAIGPKILMQYKDSDGNFLCNLEEA